MKTHSLEFENHVLGCLLVCPRADDLAEVYEALEPEHFYDHDYRLSYRAMRALYRNGQPVNEATVIRTLEKEVPHQDDNYWAERVLHLGVTEAPGGELMRCTISDPVRVMAHEIREVARLRGVVDFAKDFEREVDDDEYATANQLIGRGQKRLEELGKEDPSAVATVAHEGLMDAVEDWIHGLSAMSVPFCFRKLDEISGGGMRPGNLIYLAGRPGMGKTSLAMAIAYRTSIAGTGNGVLFCTMEITKADLQRNLVCSLGGTSPQRPIPSRLEQGMQALAVSDNLHIADVQVNTVDKVRAVLNQKKSLGIKLVILDHLGKIRSEDPSASRYEQVSEISRSLKELALQHNIVVMCLAQLNRAVEQREDKRPKKSDMRDSGTLEEDADMILMCYRDGYYQNEPNDTRAEVLVEKNKIGPPGRVHMEFHGETLSWKDREDYR